MDYSPEMWRAGSKDIDPHQETHREQMESGYLTRRFKGTSKNPDLLRANPVFFKGFGEGKRDKISIIRGLLKN
jgi:hypothetical protein